MKKEIKSSNKKTYITPDIKVIKVEIEQNILAGGSAPDMPGEDW